MGDRIDRFRSIVRSAAREAVKSASGAIGSVGPLAQVRAAVREIRDRRARIPERELSRAVLRAGTVAAASVRTRAGRIEITAELESGRAVAFALIPVRASFAPRGAKEIFFAVDPVEAAADSKVRDVAGAIAAQVARALWGPVLPPGADEPALVDRDGDELRIDLRTCPAVRAAIGQGAAAAMVMDVITIERFDADAQGLSMKLSLPRLA